MWDLHSRQIISHVPTGGFLHLPLKHQVRSIWHWVLSVIGEWIRWTLSLIHLEVPGFLCCRGGWVHLAPISVSFGFLSLLLVWPSDGLNLGACVWLAGKAVIGKVTHLSFQLALASLALLILETTSLLSWVQHTCISRSCLLLSALKAISPNASRGHSHQVGLAGNLWHRVTVVSYVCVSGAVFVYAGELSSGKWHSEKAAFTSRPYSSPGVLYPGEWPS